MGSYNVWTLSPTARYEDVCATIQPYFEVNSIPEFWPGLSYDYMDVLEQEPAQSAYARLRQEGIDQAPSVLVCPRGQIHLDQNEDDGADWDMPALLPGGYEEMLNELADRKGWTVSRLNWHG